MSIGVKYAVLFAAFLLGILNVNVLGGEITRKFDYKDFKAVDAGYGMHVKISQADSYSIEVRADERDFKYFKAEKSGDKVRFYIDKWSFRKKGEIYVTITMPVLTELTLSGGSMGDINMSSSKPFGADLSGGAGLSGNLKCANAIFLLSGGSRVDLSGSGNRLKIDGSGGSTFKLKQFAVTEASAELSGGSHAQLTVNGKLRTSQSGGSGLTYSGNTVVEKTDLSGGSNLNKE